MNTVMNIEPLQARLEAFGARAFSVNRHNLEALAAPAHLAPDGRPLVVLCYTDPTKGLPMLKSRRPKLHYVQFKDEAERQLFAACVTELQNQL